jgi:hypothetical protein
MDNVQQIYKKNQKIGYHSLFLSSPVTLYIHE